jgi:hypothetical protein
MIIVNSSLSEMRSCKIFLTESRKTHNSLPVGLPMAPICPGAICPYVELNSLPMKPKVGHSSKKQEINASVEKMS